ncbi:MAG: 30S ribosomal protein S4 [archaeon]|nr:30S ribosomal protein S4 [archaeon]
MGDPKKRRKMYQTPRKKWDKQLLASERKLLDFYGIKNKKELRKHEAWLKNKRQIARKLLALQLDKRVTREKELMSSLSRIGLAKPGTTTLDDILALQIEALLEKRLQTIVLRKGLANTSKQARQFITHGHIAVRGRKIDSPSYLVLLEEAGEVGWYKTPLQVENAPQKKDMKKEFEEAKGEEAALETEPAVKIDDVKVDE